MEESNEKTGGRRPFLLVLFLGPVDVFLLYTFCAGTVAEAEEDVELITDDADGITDYTDGVISQIAVLLLITDEGITDYTGVR